MANASLNGFLSIWKPPGATSFDIVKRLRRASRVKRVGHGGTLDPAAEGVLPILFGQATRLSNRIEELAKGYEGEILLGTVTDTLDMDGTVLDTRPTDHVTEQALRDTIPEFTGEIQQVPPMYSALKHQGERLYEIARRGEEVQREPRAVMVYGIDVQSRCPAPRAFVRHMRAWHVCEVPCGGHRRETRLRRCSRWTPASSRRAVQREQLDDVGRSGGSAGRRAGIGVGGAS